MPLDTEIDAGAEQAQAETAPAKTQLEVLREAIQTAPADDDSGDDDAESDSGTEESVADAGDGVAPAAVVDSQPVAQPVEDELYKMPEGLQAKSQERFRQLVDNSKTLAAQVQERDSQIGQMREATDWLRQEVFTDDDAPADLVQFASYRKALKSGDFDTAAQLLQAQAQQLALASGKQIAVDPLASFPEIRQRVDAMELDEGTALELARSRQQAAAQQHQQAAQQQSQQQQFAYQQQATQAVQRVESMCADWKAKDIDWPAKEKILMEQMPTIMQSYPPHMIPGQIKLIYESVSRVMPAQQQTRAPAPLRGTGRSAGSAAPASALDAMRQKLGYT